MTESAYPACCGTKISESSTFALGSSVLDDLVDDVRAGDDLHGRLADVLVGKRPGEVQVEVVVCELVAASTVTPWL